MTKNVHQRLAEVMGKIRYIQREKKQGMTYSAVMHDAVTALVRDPLLESGVIYYPVRVEHTHNGNRAECGMTVRFANVDDPKDFIDVQSFGYGVDTQDKGPGKAMSYAVKYALLKALGLETGDDPDTESIPHTKQDPAVEAPKATETEIETAQSIISQATSLEVLAGLWKGYNANAPHVAAHADVIAAKDKRKAELQRKDAA